MMTLKGLLNKGAVKYSLGLLVLILFLVSAFFVIKPTTGEGAKNVVNVKDEVTTNNPDVITFHEIGNRVGDRARGESISRTVHVPSQELQNDNSKTKKKGSSNGFSGGGSGGGGSPVVMDDNSNVNSGVDEICNDGNDNSDCADPACAVYCDPKSPGYWKNHLDEAKSLLGCVHEADIFEDINRSDIEYILNCGGNCSNMLNKLKKFLLATILNVCGGYFGLDDTFAGHTIEYWIEQSISEVENGTNETRKYYKDALDNIVNGGIDCYPERHTECKADKCILVKGEGKSECAADGDCVKCEPPYLEVSKDANPSEILCEETRITLAVTGEGKACEQYYPVDVVLVFDRSGSMNDDGWDETINDWQPIGDAKIAAKNFVDLLGGNDRAGLVSFATKASLDEPLTFDHQDVKDAI